jgi:hypothetical protein
MRHFLEQPLPEVRGCAIMKRHEFLVIHVILDVRELLSKRVLNWRAFFLPRSIGVISTRFMSSMAILCLVRVILIAQFNIIRKSMALFNGYHRNHSLMCFILLLVLIQFLSVWVFPHYLLVLELAPKLRNLHLFQNSEVSLKLDDLVPVKGQLLHEFGVVYMGHSVGPLVRKGRKV